ncbi:N-acetyltransferase [Cryobacterium sp. SO1]|uniref:GNAT family N-acetyltransferase n=1 Tax=Cryobacterium sp. SO1 TaxID=1897061 RepID=UPI0010E9CE75|nr:GNAT family N-acetyltransferase [Cryobacterium sp. SO1]RZI34590.1 putative acetyltransferase OgpAT [Cryobacterium sp. SO1]
MNRIRPYEPRDLTDLYEICVRTGASGGDATGQYESDNLLGDIFAAPYATFEPELAFVVDTGDRVSGYLVGTANTSSFVKQYREDWLPRFDARYPLVEPAVTANQKMVARGHNPDSMITPGTELFPAHLHIDLLPQLQGQGLGRILLRTLLAALRERDVPGVHLGVGIHNLGARAFYSRVGFRPLPIDPTNETVLGIRTDAEI